MVEVVVVLDIVVMRRESMVMGGITGELEGNCEDLGIQIYFVFKAKYNLYQNLLPNFKAMLCLLVLVYMAKELKESTLCNIPCTGRGQAYRLYLTPECISVVVKLKTKNLITMFCSFAKFG